ncbi:hypothetical protein Ancab_003031 [Ancistrocladus abbreviatus]
MEGYYFKEEKELSEEQKYYEGANTEGDGDEKQEAEPAEKAPRRTNCVEVSKPEAEPECFLQHRNMGDLWMDVFHEGKERDQLDSVCEYNWDFSNLEDALEEGGELHGKDVTLCGSTETKVVRFKDEEKVITIPVVVAVVKPLTSEFQNPLLWEFQNPLLSEFLGHHTAQKETFPEWYTERDRSPHITGENRFSRTKSKQFIYWRTRRRHWRTRRRYWGTRRRTDFMPTKVEIVDDLDLLGKKLRAARKAYPVVRKALVEASEETNVETEAALENVKVYKFYPVPTTDTPDVSGVKVPFINWCYGKADKIF